MCKSMSNGGIASNEGGVRMSAPVTRKLLRVNLTNNNVTIEDIDMNIYELYIGGKGLGAYLLYEELKPGIDPLSSDNKLMFVTGPLTGTLAPTNRVVVVTKSALTNTFSDSYAGGRFGPQLKYAGYDVLIVEGKAKKPVYIWIDDSKVEIRDASHLWSKSVYETDELLKKELYDKNISTACIGPGGENLVRFSCVSIDKTRQAARGGCGAVMGSKLLKAVAVRGTGGINVADYESFRSEVEKAWENLMKSPVTGKNGSYPIYGTPAAVALSSRESLFPTRNFQDESFEKWESICGEAQKERIFIRSRACYACPIACSKLSKTRFDGSERIFEGVEYETTALLGANCGLDNLDALAYSNYLCDQLGIDTISTGSVISFAIECFEKGLITTKDTDGLELKFGDGEVICTLIEKIAYRDGFGDLLAEGVKRVSEKIGEKSSSFAMHVKGQEIAGWGIRGSYGMALAYATADRGADHQRSWPIAFEVESMTWPGTYPLPRYTIEGKAKLVKWQQDYWSSIYSLVLCAMTLDGFNFNNYLGLINSSMGWNLDEKDFLLIGERIWNKIRLFNIREGFCRKNDILPERCFTEPILSGAAKGKYIDRQLFQRMLDEYYKLRGWDEEGKPTRGKLEQLGIS